MEFIRKKYRIDFLSQRGFTLIEFVLYVGMLSILVIILSAIFTSIVDVQLESNVTSSVDQDGRYILAKLGSDFQSNYPVKLENPSVPGSTSANLQINVNNDSVDTTYAVSNGNLMLTNNQGVFQVNSYDTSIANFIVTRIGLGGSNDTVQVKFTISSRARARNGYETKTFQSAFTTTD